jgi:hypothetical protein
MVLNEHLPMFVYSKFVPCVHEYGGGEVLLLLPPASDASDSELELSVLREPRIVAPAASDPIPDIIEPDPTTHVAPMD